MKTFKSDYDHFFGNNIRKLSEVKLAEHCISYIKRKYPKADIYQEVPRQSGGSIDIVVVKDDENIGIEVKTSLCFKVLEQALGNKHQVHKSFICVPYPKKGRNYSIFKHICEVLKLGLLLIADYGIMLGSDSEKIEKPLKLNLYEEQKDYVKAGSTGGKCFTPFRKTLKNLLEYVKENNGIRLKDALENIDHHYGKNSTAYCCLLKFIGTEVFPECRLDRGKIYLVEENI